MFPIERREKIIENLEQNGSITVEALAQKLEVTPTTIRRDLKYLEDNDRITRTFGGAVVKEGLVEEIAVAKKASAYQAEKKRIAREAEKLVEDGQTIVLDAGTTNMELALLLARGTKQISVVTDDILIAARLLEAPLVDVHCTGGHVQKDVGVCLGGHAEAFFGGINADIAFLGASAVDVEKGVSSPSMEKAALKQPSWPPLISRPTAARYRPFIPAAGTLPWACAKPWKARVSACWMRSSLLPCTES